MRSWDHPSNRRRLVQTTIVASLAVASGMLSATPSVAAGISSLVKLSAELPFAITEARLVTDDDDQKALAKCEALGKEPGATWVTAGINWGAEEGSSTRLCVRRQSVDSLAHGGSGNSTNQVLTRFAVLESASSCPGKMKLLDSSAPMTLEPTLTQESQGNAVVCVLYENAHDAIERRNYISDITVTPERNYNNQFAGWTTIPTNMRLKSSADKERKEGVRRLTESEEDNKHQGSFNYQGAFISFRRPALPIVDFKVLCKLSPQKLYQACQELGTNATNASFWEQAGDGYIDDKDDLTVLCVQRAASGEDKKILTKVEIKTSSDSSSHCELLSSKGDDKFHLCATFDSAESTSKPVFLGDLALVRTRLKAFDEQIVPGSWHGLKDDVNHRVKDSSTFLFYRGTDDLKFDMPKSLDKPPLRARKEGDGLSFKVLQLADIHITGDPDHQCRDVPEGMDSKDCVESLTIKFIKDLLEVEKPDMVVYTGDNVETFKPELREVAMASAFQPVEDSKIPWAMVIGNHDDENDFERERIMDLALAKKYSYVQRGPTEVDGVGNYELEVFGPGDDDKTAVFRMYFLDSHNYPDGHQYPDTKTKYDWVKQSQIDYYQTLSMSHSDRVPALMFFHVPLPEYDMASKEALSGERNEGISSPKVGSNLFSTLVDQNEVKAVFVGHDHINEFCTKREGIQLCFGGGAGFGEAYGKDTFKRRARVIEWSRTPGGARTIKSWKRYHDAMEEIKNKETLYQE